MRNKDSGERNNEKDGMFHVSGHDVSTAETRREIADGVHGRIDTYSRLNLLRFLLAAVDAAKKRPLTWFSKRLGGQTASPFSLET